jgi:hypothetical protein
MIVENLLNAKVKRKLSLVLGAASLAFLMQTQAVMGMDAEEKYVPKPREYKKVEALTYDASTREDPFDHDEVTVDAVNAFKARLEAMDKILDPKDPKFSSVGELDADYMKIIQDIPVSKNFGLLYTNILKAGVDIGIKDKGLVKIRNGVNAALVAYLDTMAGESTTTDAGLVSAGWDELEELIKAKQDRKLTKVEEAEKKAFEEEIEKKKEEARLKKEKEEREAAEAAEAARLKKEEEERKAAEAKAAKAAAMEKKLKAMGKLQKMQEIENQRLAALTGQVKETTAVDPRTGQRATGAGTHVK